MLDNLSHRAAARTCPRRRALHRARHPRRGASSTRSARTSSSISRRRPTSAPRSSGPTTTPTSTCVGTISVLEAARRARRAGRLRLDRRRDLRRVRAARRGGRAAAAGLARTGSRSWRRGVPRRLEPAPRDAPRRRSASRTSTGRARTRRLEGGVVAIFLERLAAASRRSIFGDGEQTRDFVYVGDVVAALLAAAGHDGGVFNVGTGHRDVGERAARGSAARSPESTREPSYVAARPGDARRSVLDVSLRRSASSAGGRRSRSTTASANLGVDPPRLERALRPRSRPLQGSSRDEHPLPRMLILRQEKELGRRGRS